VLTRYAGAGDIDGLVRLINAAFAVEGFIYDGERTNAAECAELLHRGRFVLAEEAASLIGCVYLELRGGHGYFGLLSVDPSRQGKGIGRALVSLAEDWFRNQGCCASQLLIISVRTELRQFYQQLGYHEVGTAPFPPEVVTHLPCHFVKMSKPLS
jgi:GNAT superfamily N-acetyltransferase